VSYIFSFQFFYIFCFPCSRFFAQNFEKLQPVGLQSK